MEEKFSFKTWSLVFFLLLLGGNNPAFASQSQTCDVTSVTDTEEVLNNSMLEAQVSSLFDSILPLQKPILFQQGSVGTIEDYKFHNLNLTTTSLGYLKRSRFLEPGLGVKQVIFPFHVFF
ncbi:hypothetical protein [Salinimicrobium xinjiangense]|uniref:hypothetical protein n=1 Tax=Salinimicrobium xinjiangense TaxID=438596 RepID=UPI000427F855|nr:hypothetical protein [Salinimicrobium xinjiangense]